MNANMGKLEGDALAAFVAGFRYKPGWAFTCGRSPGSLHVEWTSMRLGVTPQPLERTITVRVNDLRCYVTAYHPEHAHLLPAWPRLDDDSTRTDVTEALRSAVVWIELHEIDEWLTHGVGAWGSSGVHFLRLPHSEREWGGRDVRVLALFDPEAETRAQRA